jgi:MFS family permease
LRRSTFALLTVSLIDELWSGVAVVSAPDVERSFELDHGGYTLSVFALPLLLGAIVEAGAELIVYSLPRRRVLSWSYVALSFSLALCALAPSAWLLGVGLALAGAASGAAGAAAEAELVATHGADLDRVMARWMVFGGVGDIMSPALIALVLALHGSYSMGFVIVLLCTLLQSLQFARTGSTAEANYEESEASVSLLQALRESLSDVRLWAWVTGTALCTLLDEIVAALAALRLRTDLGASEAQATLCVAAFAVGVVLGALLTERVVVRWGWRRVLLASSGACALALPLVTIAQSISGMTAGLLVLGACAAPHYPLLLARAYESAPGRTTIVNAMQQVFVILELLLPPALGALADRLGLSAAIALLMLQPLGVFGLALWGGGRAHGPPPQ